LPVAIEIAESLSATDQFGEKESVRAVSVGKSAAKAFGCSKAAIDPVRSDEKALRFSEKGRNDVFVLFAFQ